MKTVRLSVLIGAGLLAGGLAAGPAQASPGHSHDDNDVIGYFADESDCEAVADRLGRWDDDAYCDEVDGGPHDGMYALTVDCDDHDDGWYVRYHHFYDDNDFPFDHHFPFGSGWAGFPFV